MSKSNFNCSVKRVPHCYTSLKNKVSYMIVREALQGSYLCYVHIIVKNSKNICFIQLQINIFALVVKVMYGYYYKFPF